MRETTYFTLLCGILILFFVITQSQGAKIVDLRFDKLKCSTECSLALGYRVHFAALGEADLMMIDGISSILAAAIMSNKNQIILAGRAMDPRNSHQALEVVRGIGPKKAARLAKFLEIN